MFVKRMFNKLFLMFYISIIVLFIFDYCVLFYYDENFQLIKTIFFFNFLQNLFYYENIIS